jgi:lysophospholipase L1-like esterase
MPASAANANSARYLALGDSISFGYDPLKPVSESSYVGYPEILSDAMKQHVANASCFGETSSSFLGAAPDLGCSEWKLTHLPMHVDYAAPTQTQMSYASDLLEKHTDKIKLITISLGGNDLGLILKKCTTASGLDVACAQQELPATLGAYAKNLGEIYGRIRMTGYSGPIVAVTYYAFNYAGTDLFTEALKQLNFVMSQVTPAFQGTVVDGFDAFRVASAGFGGNACAAGLLVKLDDGSCDTHPSEKGQKILANAIAAAISK